MAITVRPIPKMSMRTKAIRIEKGMVKEAMKELLKFHMKKTITRMIRMAPSKIETSTCFKDFRMRID
jgi:hypothetical protein